MRQRWRKTYRNYSRYNPDSEHQYYQYASGKPYVGAGWDGFTNKNPLHTGKDDYLDYLKSRGSIREAVNSNRRDPNFHFDEPWKRISERFKIDFFKDAPKIPDMVNTNGYIGNEPFNRGMYYEQKEFEWSQRQHGKRMNRLLDERMKYMNKVKAYSSNTNIIQEEQRRKKEYIADLVRNSGPQQTTKVDGQPFLNAGQNSK